MPAAIERGGRAGGQIIVMFALSIMLLFGILALVIDVGAMWNESLHVQLAAEAAALAGVPYMPGDFATATTKAQAEATKNGYTTGSGTTVSTAVDAESNRRLDVTITRTYSDLLPRPVRHADGTVTRTATGEYTLPVPMGSPLSVYGDNSGRFWAAAEAQGSNRSYGDAYGTYYNPSPTLNNQYDSNGYMYAIDVPSGAGATNIDLYDPGFCAVDDQKGTGDHWIPWNATNWPAMSTYYTLWSDPASTPLDYTDDVQVASSGTLFANQRAVDKSAALRNTQASWPGDSFWSLPDCQADAYHNHWWTLTTVTTPGTYRLQVTTTNAANPNDQKNTSAENMWSLRAVAANPTYAPYVYGLGKMVIYANAANGTTSFYLSRIEAVHAGKTMVIQLFDPGDASGNSSLQIMKPTSTGYSRRRSATPPTRTRPARKSGTNVTSLATTINGTGQYNNSWVTSRSSCPRRQRSSATRRAGRRTRRLVEDQLHLRQRDDRHDHLAGVDPRQPRPSRPALTAAPRR